MRAVRRRSASAFLLLLTAWLLTFAPVQARADLDFPPLTGRVVDGARLLQPAARDAITAKLAALEADTGDQFVVVTVAGLQDREIEDYGYQLGRAWGIGQSENDIGVLLIVAPVERKVRIEVGYGLEPVLTDALSNHIIQTQILPPFREGGYQRGIVAGVDAVIAQLRLDPAEAQARAAAIEPAKPDLPVGPAVIVVLVFLFLFIGVIRASFGGGRRRRGGLGPIMVWAAADMLRHSSRSDGGFGGGGGGGGFGGFSGGGGSFGGGGASGGW